MPFSRRVAIPLSAATLSLFFAGTATAATATSPGALAPSTLPSNCSWYGIEPATVIVHCGGLPANEEWRAGADCYNDVTGQYIFKYGGLATGDSSSAITACYPRENLAFYPVS